jgi:outer membrane protein OmpA-like peptidoglycan-associated protein
MSKQWIHRALAVLCLAAAPALAGCNTVSGFGEDVSSAADTTHDWMFGDSAQAAERAGGMTPEEEAMPSAGGNAVYFTSGSATLGADAREMLRTTADAMSGRQGTRIEVVGFADTAGPADLNDRLSQRRAEAVAAELGAQGVSREMIDVTWRGEEELAIPTGDNVSEAENRRVTLDFSTG